MSTWLATFAPSLLSQLLFHGTSRGALLAIMRDGLDMRKSSLHGAYGGGM